MEKQKLKYNENKIDDLEEKIQTLLKQKELIKQKQKEIKIDKQVKANNKIFIIGIIICIILSIMLGLITTFVYALIPILPAVIFFVIIFIKNNKVKKEKQKQQNKIEDIMQQNKQIEKKIYEIDAQIQILEKNQKEQIQEADILKNEIIKNINLKKENIKNEYNEKLNLSEVNLLLNANNLNHEIEKIQSKINDININLHRLNLDKENILPKLEQLAENEEKLTINKEIYQELKNKNDAINLAKQIIEQSYQKMKNDVTPRFTQKLSENIAHITNNKYSKVIISEDEGILIELPNGEYKNASRLSKGTIQQLYLSFRLSLIDDISEENMPIILDEVFAYYDDKRLKETLKNIEKYYSKNHQIILLTCTNREELALNELGVKYNKINL